MFLNLSLSIPKSHGWVNGKWWIQLEVQLLSIVPGFGLVPQSGYVLQPRVAAAATLGLELNGQSYRNAVAARGRNPFRVGNHVA